MTRRTSWSFFWPASRQSPPDLPPAWAGGLASQRRQSDRPARCDRRSQAPCVRDAIVQRGAQHAPCRRQTGTQQSRNREHMRAGQPRRRRQNLGTPAVMLRPANAAHPRMNLLRHRTATRRLVGVALLALMLGQWALLAHTIAHAPGSVAAAVAVVSDTGTDDDWDHQAGTAQCHLLDHLLAGQAPGADSATPACPPPTTTRLAAPAPANEPGAALPVYEARGPPRA